MLIEKNTGGCMTVDNILTILKDIIDICLVWAGLYFILKSKLLCKLFT